MQNCLNNTKNTIVVTVTDSKDGISVSYGKDTLENRLDFICLDARYKTRYLS